MSSAEDDPSVSVQWRVSTMYSDVASCPGHPMFFNVAYEAIVKSVLVYIVFNFDALHHVE